MKQLKIHKKIDDLRKVGVESASVDSVRELIGINADARRYFYRTIDAAWFDFLFDNDLLESIKEPASEGDQWKMPELNYIDKVSSEIPAKVTELILSTENINADFNKDTLYTYLRIAGSLPVDSLVKIASKIHDENWVKLMVRNDVWGFDYEHMLKTLVESEKYKELILIAETVLSIRSKEELRADNNNPFYLSDLQHSNVLGYLNQVPDEYLKPALQILLRALSAIVISGEKETDREGAFAIQETFHLFDVDFFKTKLGTKKHISYRDDVRDVAALISELTEKYIGQNCGDTQSVKTAFDELYSDLPNARTMWRLKLYVLSLCPEAFSDELQAAYNRIFEFNTLSTIYDLVGGAEYERALMAGFEFLSSENQRKYVSSVLTHFDNLEEEEKKRARYALDILSIIKEHLTSDEKAQIEAKGWSLHDEEPSPSVGPIVSYDVERTAPISADDFRQLSISEVITKLKAEWTSDLIEVESFNGPSMEGAGELLREDVPNRPTKYLENLTDFFDREAISSSYTYDVLRGIENSIREGKLNKLDALPSLLAVILLLKESSEQELFEEEQKDKSRGRWLAGWRAVHDVCADILMRILEQGKDEEKIPFAQVRADLLNAITYLLSHEHPTHEKEISSGDDDLTAEPFGNAINSVRGRAFQCFVMFIQHESFNQSDSEKKIPDDVREIYLSLLDREDTYALYFMFGHYLPTCYFRDKEWVNAILPKIFPESEDKHDYYIAALDGLLTNNLYGELMSEHSEIYERAIDLDPDNYTKRRYGKELDETLATHIALAYIHFDEFQSLVDKFWASAGTERAKAFVSFIGRHAVTGKAAQNVKKEKIEEIWDYILERCSDKEALMEFGFWARYEGPVLLDDKWTIEQLNKTLEKTGGVVSWEHGIVESLPRFAEADPAGTLHLIGQMLLGSDTKPDERPWHMHVDRETKEALEKIYESEELKLSVVELVDHVLPLANGEYWVLKDVVEDYLAKL